MKQKRMLVICAHPDDCDELCGATAYQWVRAGHVVKFVSATTGDTGHQILSREETAAVRKKEAEAAGKFLGLAEYQVLDHPCGLEATLTNRQEMIRLIRRFKPDVVLSHRPCDYHPDHRATAQLVMDCAYVVMVPHNCEDTPIPDEVPIFAYTYDAFEDPRPLRIDAAIPFDEVLDAKLANLRCHKSQFFEWLPWCDMERKTMDISRMSEPEIRAHLLHWMERWLEPTRSQRCQEILSYAYGAEAAGKVRYAELFEQSPYSRHLSQPEFQRFMMP